MTLERESEELAAQVVLDELARASSPDDTAVVPPDDEVAEVLGRLYLEAFGLLAYGVEPAGPPRGAREALLGRLAGDETQEVEPLGEPPVEPPGADVRPVADSAPVEPTPSLPPEPPAPTPARAPAAPSSEHAAALPPPEWSGAQRTARRGGLALWIALLLALVAIGLGVYCAYLLSELESERSRQRRVEREATAAESAAREEVDALSARLDGLEHRHDLVTTPAVTVYALRPPAGARQPLARGALWLAPDGKRWLLEVRGLGPDPPGRDYQLWFIVDGLPLSAGVFGAEAGRVAMLEDVTMPAGATGVAVTLEREGGAPGPSGPPILLGTNPVRL